MMMKKRVKVFPQLKEALEEALAYEQGKPVDLRVTELPSPPRPLAPGAIREIRISLNASQTQFARLLNVSPNAVESWEQGARHPRNATLKLLLIARKNPQVLLQP
jgi:putative transcriptional regulator